jgi:hypothetical protein
MPAARAGESKQALIITLVFFILLSIILGVFTYMGYADADKLLKDKNTAENNEKNAKTERDGQRNLMLVARTYMGLPPADKKELTVAYEDVGKLAAKDDNAKTLQDLEKTLGWDKNKGLPNTDFMRRVAELEKKTKELQDMVAQKEDESKKREAEAKRYREQRDGFEVDAKKKLDEINARANADLEKYKESLRKQLESFGDQGKIIEALKDEGANKDVALKKLADANNKRIKELQTQLDKLDEKKVKFTSQMFDQPRGKIVRMDKTGTQPFINLGKEDRVRPQLTFSIHALGTDGRPLKESKGSLEIVTVISDHLSQTRITSQGDATRDPVVSGDVLMNSAWDPNQKRHVAIAGIVDLTSEGLKNRPAEALRAVEEFMRSLENQGIVVDAWIDFVDNSIKGKGITSDTDYLILGDVPKARVGIVPEGNASDKRQEDVVKLRTKMIDEATRVGTPVIKLRDFLTMTGYRVPRPKESPDIFSIHKALPAVGSPIDKTFAKQKAEEDAKEKERKEK